MSAFDDLAEQVADLEARVADELFGAVRAQLGGDARAAEVERQLARVRRSLLKAEALLRALSDQEDEAAR